MKNLGIALLVIGITWALIAFNKDTTVKTEERFIAGILIPSQQVHNIGKIEERRNSLMLAGLMIVAGVILFSFGHTRQPAQIATITGDSRSCLFCAEAVKPEAKICKHCGKDIQNKQSTTENKSLNDEIKDAIYRNDIEKVESILHRGLVIDDDNHDSVNPLEYADLYDRKEILKLLQAYKANETSTRA